MDNPSRSPEIFDYVDSRTLPLTQGLLIGGVLALVLLCLGLLIWQWRAKRRSGKPKVVLNPWEELRNELKLSVDRAPEHRLQVLRRVLAKALELRTKKPFTALTTSEMVRELASQGAFSSDFQAQCVEFFKATDQAIFAKVPVSLKDRETHEQQVAHWLESLEQGQAL